MSLHFGTCKYYSQQGFSAEDVSRKLMEREIHIGEPLKRAGDVLYLDGDGRYHVQAAEA